MRPPAAGHALQLRPCLQGPRPDTEFLGLLPERPAPISVQRFSLRRLGLALLVLCGPLIVVPLLVNWAVGPTGQHLAVHQRHRLRRPGGAVADGPGGAVGQRGAVVLLDPEGWALNDVKVGSGFATIVFDIERPYQEAAVTVERSRRATWPGRPRSAPAAGGQAAHPDRPRRHTGPGHPLLYLRGRPHDRAVRLRRQPPAPGQRRILDLRLAPAPSWPATSAGARRPPAAGPAIGGVHGPYEDRRGRRWPGHRRTSCWPAGSLPGGRRPGRRPGLGAGGAGPGPSTPTRGCPPTRPRRPTRRGGRQVGEVGQSLRPGQAATRLATTSAATMASTGSAGTTGPRGPQLPGDQPPGPAAGGYAERDADHPGQQREGRLPGHGLGHLAAPAEGLQDGQAAAAPPDRGDQRGRPCRAPAAPPGRPAACR